MLSVEVSSVVVVVALVLFDVSFKVERAWKTTFTLNVTFLLEDVATKSKY